MHYILLIQSTQSILLSVQIDKKQIHDVIEKLRAKRIDSR